MSLSVEATTNCDPLSLWKGNQPLDTEENLSSKCANKNSENGHFLADNEFLERRHLRTRPFEADKESFQNIGIDLCKSNIIKSNTLYSLD
jgi:hypothetical protein